MSARLVYGDLYIYPRAFPSIGNLKVLSNAKK